MSILEVSFRNRLMVSRQSSAILTMVTPSNCDLWLAGSKLVPTCSDANNGGITDCPFTETGDIAQFSVPMAGNPEAIIEDTGCCKKARYRCTTFSSFRCDCLELSCNACKFASFHVANKMISEISFSNFARTSCDCSFTTFEYNAKRDKILSKAQATIVDCTKACDIHLT